MLLSKFGHNFSPVSLPKVLNITDIKTISCGNYHTIVLTNSGSLYTTGRNAAGQLGIGSNVDTNIFTQCQDVDDIQKNNSIISISCGAFYTLLLTNSGSLYATGSNQFGQFGNGENIDKNVFTLCQNSQNIQGKIVSIACGYSHTAIVTDSGYLYTTGSNNYGQLGIGSIIDKNVFTLCENIDFIQGNITAVSCGGFHTALICNLQIYTTGYNSSGQLGIKSNINTNIFTLCYDVDYMQGTIISISCGEYHTAFLRKTLYIYTTGANIHGQLGIGNFDDTTIFTRCLYVDNIGGHTISISCGYYHTALLTDSKLLYTTGYNEYGELGIGDNISKNAFTLCENIDNIQENITLVSCGGHHTALISNLQIYTTGYNNYGQLGIGSNTDKNVFAQTNLGTKINDNNNNSNNNNSNDNSNNNKCKPVFWNNSCNSKISKNTKYSCFKP